RGAVEEPADDVLHDDRARLHAHAVGAEACAHGDGERAAGRHAAHAVEIRSEDAIEDLLADLEAATVDAPEEADLEARQVREDVAAEGVEPGGARRCVGAGLEPRGHDGAAPEAEAELAFEGVFDERARASHAARGPAKARDGTQRAEGGPRR